MHPKLLSINDYTYHLPPEKIALHPLKERSNSRLLIWKQGEIKEDIYANIAEYLPSNSLAIYNNTKVIPARILFKKDTGGTIEIFCLEPAEDNPDYSTVMTKHTSVKWKCMIGGASKWKEGTLSKKINIKNEVIILSVSLRQKLTDAYVAEFTWQPSNYSFVEIIEHAGEMPLPPYIKRKAEEEDKERYQTFYAEHQGSVAAPTAGLHFTPEVFTNLKEKNISTGFVTLHVGAGTFKPVKSGIMEGHEMHSEWIDIPFSTIENILQNLKENIIAVGTTSLRTIESLYWMGVKSYADKDCSIYELEIKQWEVYEERLLTPSIDKFHALESLLHWMKKHELQRLVVRTQILIAPGYQFKIANALVTNFHQPQSTLLLLVAAITKDWKNIYNYALKNDFRFLSYGDGCLLFV